MMIIIISDKRLPLMIHAIITVFDEVCKVGLVHNLITADTDPLHRHISLHWYKYNADIVYITFFYSSETIIDGPTASNALNMKQISTGQIAPGSIVPHTIQRDSPIVG